MLSAISGVSVAPAVQPHAQPAPAPSISSSNALPQDKVTLSPQAQAASAHDVDHDGDSH